MSRMEFLITNINTLMKCIKSLAYSKITEIKLLKIVEIRTKFEFQYINLEYLFDPDFVK